MRRSRGAISSGLCRATALAVLLAANAAFAELKVVEVRPTYGRLGATRPSTKVLPGEDLNVTYIVSGVSRGADGRAEVSRSAELFDEDGEVQARVPAKSSRLLFALGGESFASHMHFSLPFDFSPGKYIVRGTLTDARSGDRVVAEQEFEVLPLDFGIVRLRLAADAAGIDPIGGNLTLNQDVFVVGRAIGFARKGRRIHVVGNMTISDAAGRPTMPAPIAFEVDQEVDDELAQLDVNWSLVVNRPGKFTVTIEVRDEIAGKRAVYELPLAAAPPPQLERGRAPVAGQRKNGE
ncbi:MAG: hypothetical protein ACT4QC_12385 [Planctomycetaceae bacterium]